MKNNLWKIDPTGKFSYSDIANPGQYTLADFSGIDFRKIIEILLELKGSILTIEEIKMHITLNSPYPTLRLRIDVLKIMEKEKKLKGLDPRKRMYTYPGDEYHVQII